MKKLIATLAVVSVGFIALGQGQVNFVNTATTLVTTNSTVGGPATGSATGASAYWYGLFWAPSGEVNPAAFTFSGAYGTNLASAGRFSGGAGTGAPGIAGQAIGTTVNVYIAGWSANLGRNWASVQAALANPTEAFWYGTSGIGTVVLGGGAQPVPNIFGSNAGQVSTGFTLGLIEPAIIPEPSTFALAGLGLAGLLIFRRRK